MAINNFVAEPGKQKIIITGIYDAPRELVFKTVIDPWLIPQWWGPKRFTTTVDKMNVKKGGIWRFTQRDAAGNQYAFNGVYHDISSPERLIYTFEFEGMPGRVSLETVTYEVMDNKTKATDTIVFQSVEDRDEMLNSGMQDGAEESMDRFSLLLKEIKKTKLRS